MFKIIRHRDGVFKRAECYCGCIFEFTENELIQRNYTVSVPSFLSSEKDCMRTITETTVRCPECSMEIRLNERERNFN